MIDIILSFFKMRNERKTLRQTSIHYFSGYFIFDFLSVLPSLIAKGSDNSKLYAFRLTRFVHANRLFKLFGMVLTKFLFSRGYNKMKVRDYVDLLTLFIFVIFATHILACIWCYFGMRDRFLPIDQKFTWVNLNTNTMSDGTQVVEFDQNNVFQIYIFSIYFVLQTLTTVGYGDYTGKDRYERIFGMVLEVRLLLFYFL